MKQRLLPALSAVLGTLICFFIFMNMIHNMQGIKDLKILNVVTDRISSTLSNAFAYSDMLDILVKLNDGNLSEQKFADLAEMSRRNNPCIDSLQYAPGAIVTYINPIEGNEAAIGHNLFEDEARRKAIIDAIGSKTIVVQGPLKSLQGKNMIFGRKAIMMNDKFWGLSIIAIDFDNLLTSCGFDSDAYDYAIAVYNIYDELDYIWGSKKIIDASQISSDVQFSNQRWHISIQAKHNFATLWNDYGIALIISILIGAAIYSIFVAYMYKSQLVKTDLLTKTLNRLEFQRRAENAFKNGSQPCALLSIDLNKFKYVNDTYGHLAGDEMLIHAAKKMQSAVREGDLVARVGGDEYAILLRDVRDEQHVDSIIARLKELTKQKIKVGDTEVSVGISVGYALFPSDGTEYKELYHIADQNMYNDKAKNHAADRKERDKK
jgi:diguanylate cyclase (GGDEF)-like protein